MTQLAYQLPLLVDPATPAPVRPAPPAPGEVMLRACPRCPGDLLYNHYDQAHECLQCGFVRYAEE